MLLITYLLLLLFILLNLIIFLIILEIIGHHTIHIGYVSNIMCGYILNDNNTMIECDVIQARRIRNRALEQFSVRYGRQGGG